MSGTETALLICGYVWLTVVMASHAWAHRGNK
jgi:hypothetical protein